VISWSDRLGGTPPRSPVGRLATLLSCRWPRETESLALSPLVLIRIALDAMGCHGSQRTPSPACERRPVDLDEHEGLRPTPRESPRPRTRRIPYGSPRLARRRQLIGDHRRLVVVSRLDSSKPSFTRTFTMSSGAASRPFSGDPREPVVVAKLVCCRPRRSQSFPALRDSWWGAQRGSPERTRPTRILR